MHSVLNHVMRTATAEPDRAHRVPLATTCGPCVTILGPAVTVCLQEDIRKEAQMMGMISHPNLVRSYCSFTKDQFLWVVMPLLEGGSCLHIMKSQFPNGLEEAVIATILRDTLIALDYLHHHGHIHRDVKVQLAPSAQLSL